MAKKSSKSKGFRRQNAKKPYLSKRDIVLLCVLFAAVAVGAFFLFRYDDGALKVQDGAVVTEGDNWLIVNGSRARGGVRYYKLGEVGELEGYARETSAISTDANIPQYVFTPEADDAAIDSITVTTSHNNAEPLGKYAASMLTDIDGNDVGELQSTELAGFDVHYFFYTTASAGDANAPVEDAEEAPAEDAEAPAEDAEEAPAEDAEETPAEDAEAPAEDAEEAPAEDAEAPAENAEEAPAEDAEETPAEDAETKPYCKTLSGYIDASHDSSVVFHLVRGADSAEDYPSDEDMLAALEAAIGTVTLESAEK